MKDLKGILIISLLLFVGEFISHVMDIMLPGAVIGMVLLALLLFFNIVKEGEIDKTCDFIKRNMILFFVPPTVSLLKVYKSLEGEIFKIFITAFLSTMIMLAVTSLVMDFTMKYFKGKR